MTSGHPYNRGRVPPAGRTNQIRQSRRMICAAKRRPYMQKCIFLPRHASLVTRHVGRSSFIQIDLYPLARQRRSRAAGMQTTQKSSPCSLPFRQQVPLPPGSRV